MHVGFSRAGGKIVPIIIPVFGREDVFGTVSMLRTQDYAARLHFIVIDNGNGPELSIRLKSLAGPDCAVVSFAENRGGSAAYIAGMDFARKNCPESPYVWLLDDDAKPNAETLPALAETMDRLVAENPRTASVGSTVVSAKDADRIVECGASFSPLLGHAFPKLSGCLMSDVGNRVLRVDYAAACSLLVNVAAVAECGFWEDVFIHFDDIEWGLRVTKKGWRNHATTASTVIHPEFDPEKAGPWVCYFDSRNMLWLASKYGALHVAAATFKDLLKNLRARLTGRHRERIFYRMLAHADFKAGIRRTRAEVVSAMNGNSDTPDLKIVVATHKPYRMPSDGAYLPLQVGAAGKPDLGFVRDDAGENLSAKNANYCELTGLYWAWKNLPCDYIGLVHYRRLFKADVARLRRLLKTTDVILPARRHYVIETNYSHYAHAHHAADLDLAREIIAVRHPAYLTAFDAVMKGRSGHRFNMFVMRRELCDAYCEWLFDILFELERRLDISSYSTYDARVFGFVAERLMDVWLKGRHLSWREVPVLNLEDQHWISKIFQFLLRKIRGSRKN